ncbi:unnamed protein product [Caenorhabditis angaria]|uniref:F-box domain-containing protein n=1 Tax=Caenorhabditis angaria TaxID=860376 RepID=A0A9P1J274_9PELO|nr:unnamed protein product [Caenorhabditis angaria]
MMIVYMLNKLTSKERKPTLTDMPHIVADNIFKNLNAFDVCRLRRVATGFRDYIEKYKMGEMDFQCTNLTIKNDVITTNRIWFPYYARNSKFMDLREVSWPFSEHFDLNWFRPRYITYANSTIFESNEYLPKFSKDVWMLHLDNIINEINQSIRKEKLNNICKKLKYMNELYFFACSDNYLTEEELATLILSLKPRKTHICVEFNQKLPCLKKSVLSAFCEITQKTHAAIRICHPLYHKPKPDGITKVEHDMMVESFRYLDEGDVEGILWFLENPENSQMYKNIIILKCDKRVRDEIFQKVLEKFGVLIPTFTEDDISMGPRCISMRVRQ